MAESTKNSDIRVSLGMEHGMAWQSMQEPSQRQKGHSDRIQLQNRGVLEAMKIQKHVNTTNLLKHGRNIIGYHENLDMPTFTFVYETRNIWYIMLLL